MSFFNLMLARANLRRMGAVGCGNLRVTPFQIDGNTGLPGVITEMPFGSQIENEQETSEFSLINKGNVRLVR